MITTLLLAQTAWAIPAASSDACDKATPSALPACDCVFLSAEEDWENPTNALNPNNTCFEFTTIVNDVPAPGRATALTRMSSVGNYYACHSGREYTKSVTWSFGVPTVTSQLLETMEEEECGTGVGIAQWREIHADGDNWMVADEFGFGLLEIIPARDLPYVPLRKAWQLDDDGDEESDDMILYWDDDRVWVVIDFVPGDTITEPEEEEEDPPRR